MAPDAQAVTRLLKQWGAGDKQALDRLMPLVYDQLRSLAGRCLASGGRENTLRATALVNEAYLRLAQSDLTFNDRVHFFAVAARLLRHILVDHARGLNRQKRGAGAEKMPLDEAVLISPETPSAILDLDEALSRLEALDKRKADVIELLFFGGLTYDEVSVALEISPATVHRELRMAKAWLHKELAAQ
jgi:RNA polymerase sigma factor (TIGR02999 family)